MTNPTALEQHAGTELEINNDGDYRIDTTGASGGEVRIDVRGGARVVIAVDGQETLIVRDGFIYLGSPTASEPLVLGFALQNFMNQFFLTKYDFHTHPTAMGPSGPPLPLFTGAQFGPDLLSNVAMTQR